MVMGTATYSVKKRAKESDSLLRELRGSSRQTAQSLAGPLATMIILRWADFQDAEGEAMAAFDGTDYAPALPAALHWRAWCDELPGAAEHESGVGHAFAGRILAVIRQSRRVSPNPLLPLLERILPSIEQLARLDAETFVRMTGWLAQQPFETFADRLRLLAAFDAFLDEAESKETGQLRTPAAVCDLLVSLAHVRPGERLYDPCFGFGGILTAACSAVANAESNLPARSQGVPLEISGVEIQPEAYTIGLARVLLAGAMQPNLELGNSLERESAPNPKKHGFDVVICNPPWGLRMDQPGLEHFPVPTNDSTALFLQHAIGQLKPNGRAVVVVPKGTIFRLQKFASLRQWLLKTCRLETLIALPEGVFLPHSAIGASVLVFRKAVDPEAKVRIINPAGPLPKPFPRRPVVLNPELIKTLVDEASAPECGENSQELPASSLESFDEDAKAAVLVESALHKALGLLGAKVPIVAIKDVCRVKAGRSVSSKDLVDRPREDAPVPFIRIGNIQHGQTVKPTSWVSAEKAAELGPRLRLRPGDVLVSKAGTIGKAGVVRNGGVSGIASAGLFVLSPDASRIDPSYLTAYIQSSACQDWLTSKAGGQVIRGLRREFIEELKVPLPPLLVQQQVAEAAREHGEDPIKTLADILSPADANPLSRWIDAGLRALAANGDEEDPSRVVRLKVLGSDSDVDQLVDDRISEVPELAGWADAMFQAYRVFCDSESIPRGTALYGVLQEGIASLRMARLAINGNSLLEARARELTEQCIERLDRAAGTFWDPEPITCQVLAEELVAGEVNIISCSIRNRSILPLRNVSVTLDGFEGGYSGFIAENSELPCSFSVKPKEEALALATTLRWRWKPLLDRLPATQETEVVFRVVPPSKSKAEVKAPLGPSPYFVSEPVGPQRREMFIGRDEVLEQIRRQLISGNTVLLEGNRRAGKSSILKQIEGIGHIPGKLAVYSSMQAAEGDKHVTGMPSEAVWRRLANDLAKGLTSLGCDVPLPDGTMLLGGKGVGISRACRKGISVEAPWEDFLEYAGAVVGLLAERGLGLVLMIDEFDKLQEGIDNEITSPQIPENIRYLIQNLPGFSAIMTGSRRMQRLRHEYWSALYGLGSRVGVTALSREAAERLVRQPVEGKLSYSPEAVDKLISLCARQPFLIQSLANLVFVAAAASGTHAITAALVDEAAQRFVEDNEHFASLMDYTESDLRRFLVMLIYQAEKDPDPITLRTLQQRLIKENIIVTDSALTNDLRFLIDLELVDFHGQRGGFYSLSVPLMGHWLDYQHDYHALLAKARVEQEGKL